MSDIFKVNLKKFLADQISLSELENITAQEANVNEAQKGDLQHIILELFNRKIITKTVFDKLYFTVSAADQSQAKKTSEPTRQVYREPTEAPAPTQPQAPAITQATPEPKIPFQESLKRFQQRKNTLRDLEKSLSDEVADNIELIPKYRVIIQKLEQQQLLHHSVCDQLNDCLNTLENNINTQPSATENYNQSRPPENANMPVDAVVKYSENLTSDTTLVSDPKNGRSGTEEPVQNANTDAGAPVTTQLDVSAISPILDNFANRRLSYEAFEDQLLQSTARLDDRESVLTELKNGLEDGKFPEIVYQSVVQALLEQFSELNDSWLAQSAKSEPVIDESEDIEKGQSEAKSQLKSQVDSETNPVQLDVDDDLTSNEFAQSLTAQSSEQDVLFEEASEQVNDTNTDAVINPDTPADQSFDEAPSFDEMKDFDIDDFDIDDIIGQPDDFPVSNAPIDESLNENQTAINDLDESQEIRDKTDFVDDFPDFLETNLAEPDEQKAKAEGAALDGPLEDIAQAKPGQSVQEKSSQEAPQSSADGPDSTIDASVSTPSRGPETASLDETNDQDDDDKTQIRFTPVKQSTPPQTAFEKSSTPPEPDTPGDPDDDKTVIKMRKPNNDDDDDKTRIQVGSQPDRTSNTQDYTSRTSQTSATSATGTSSTWSKPFEEPKEVVEIRIGAVIKERFRLTGFIGQGGMGDVYKAEDLRRVDAGDVETEVAIKLLNNEFKDHPDSLKSLQREARKTQSLAHPHIVNVFDFDRDEFHVFMTMELMRGDPLDKAIKKNKKGFGLTQATKYIKELSSALDYAHRRGIVHSDLKPGNIFLANGEIKVFDFGIARAASDSTDKDEPKDTFDAGSIGALTPSYASPEMLDGVQDADPRDDIYALGCIAYELITGKHPFLKDGKKVPSNEARDQNLKPPKIPGLKKWQAKALEECLAFDLNSRPSNVGKFLDVFLQESIQVTTKQKIIRAVGATCILGLSVGSYFYYQSYKISSFEALVDNNAHEKLIEESEELLKEDRASQQQIFDNPNIRDKFREYLTERAKLLAQQNRFADSDKMVALARKIYPDSAAINQVANEIVDIQNNRKIELYDQLDKLLSDNEYFAINYQQLRNIWQSVALISPNDERLQNTQPVFAFEELINKLIDQDKYINAKDVSDYAIEFLSQYAVFEEYVPTLNRLGNDIQRLQERSLNDERITTLVASLSPLRDVSSLVALEPFLDNIERLSNLDPNNGRLLELQTIVKPLVNQELEKQFSKYRWGQATEMTQQFASVLSKSDLIDSQDRIAEAQLAWTDTINKLKQDIRVRARQASPESAELLLPELNSIGASAEELAEMSDAIAQSWILKSRRLQETQNWSGAKTALESAQSLSASIKMVETIQSELDSLSLAQTQLASQLDRDQTEALQAQKLKRIQGFESVITDIVGNQDITQDSLSEFTAAIDSLRIEEPNNNLIANSETQLISRITQRADRLSAESVDKAISLLDLGAQFFPTNADISNLTRQLSTLKQTQLQQEDATRFTSLSSKLDEVVQGALDASSYDEISTILAQISRLKGFEPQASQLAVKAASAFVEKSKTQLRDLRFDEARDTVRYASTIDSNGTDSSELIARIDEAEKQFDQGQSELREQSRVESLRANLLSRILTMDFERAKEVRKELEQAGGLDREFTSRVRDTFVEKYSERAERSANEQKFGEAKTWINEAIQEDNTNSDLSRLYDLYNTAENIVDTRQANPQVAEQLKQAALSKFGNSAIIASIDVLVASKKPAAATASEILKAVPVAEETPVTIEPLTKAESEPVVRQPAAVINKPAITPTRRPSNCLVSMAGTGDRTNCRDQLVGKDKGPYLVVLPAYNGVTFAISKYEIRVGEYNMYCNTTGDCQAIGGNQLLPVTNLSLGDVDKFVDWLSSTTGFNYRIPTEGEWVFAATADNTKAPTIKNCKVFSGTILQYGVKIENINFQRKQTSNSWGVSNYLGNVQELITISDGYRAIGGHFEDSFSDCEINRTRSVRSNLDEKTGLRLIREL